MAHEDGRALPPLNMFEHLSDGITSECTLTEHVFLTRLGVEIGTGNTCPLLPTIMLLLHKEVELVERIKRSAVFLLIVVEGLKQAYHRHTTFVLERLHIML